MLALWAFVAISFCYLARKSGPFPGDLAVTLFLQGFPASPLRVFAQGVSFLGAPTIAAATALASAAGLWIAGRRTDGLIIAGTLLPDLLNQGLKVLIDRPRPPEGLVQVWELAGGGSFPSGHAFHAILFLGVAIFIVRRHTKNRWPKALLSLLFASLILLMGLSRIYLGVHWASDVLGGYLIGGLFLYLILLFYPSDRSRIGEG